MVKFCAWMAAALLSVCSFAADRCIVTVACENAHGDGRRLLPGANAGEYVASADAGMIFSATVLADAGYVLAESGHELPEGVMFDTTIGDISIPAETLAANAATGIRLKIVARPIVYSILYHAHGDGEPDADGGLVAANDIRSWRQTVDTRAGGKVKLAGVGTLAAEGWKFLGWSRVQGHTSPDYLPGEEVAHLTIKDGTEIRLFAVWATAEVEGTVSYPVVLQNGDFETPVVVSNYYKMFSGAVITESEIQDPNGIGWSTTSKDNMIEIGRLTASGAINKYGTGIARDGQQVAELNANFTGLLYQRISTLPNTTLHWGFSHRARGSEGMKEETLSMWVGSSDQIEQARAIYNRFALLAADDKNHLTREEAMAQVEELAQTLQFTNIVHTAVVSADASAWDDVTGDFVVPTGRNVTEYAFASWAVGTNGLVTSYGNLLDRVYLADALPAETYDLRIATGAGGTVWVNDSAAMTEIGENSSYLASYHLGTKILLTLAMAPDNCYLGIRTNGVFVARADTTAIFKALSEDGLDGDLDLEYVFAGGSQVRLRPNGGSYLDAEGNEIGEESLSMQRPCITLGEPVRRGYKFLGWRAAADQLLACGSTIVYEVSGDGSGQLAAYLPDGNTEMLRVSAADGLTLFAQWEIDENAIPDRTTWEVSLIVQNVDGDNAIMKPVDGTPGLWRGLAIDGEDFVTTIFAADGYRLPEQIDVTDEAGNALEGYRYNRSTGIVAIPGEFVTGKINIAAAAECIRYTIVYSSGGSGEIAGAGVEKVPGAVGVWQQAVDADGSEVELAAQGSLASEGWQFLGWAREASATVADYAAGARVAHLTRLDLAVVKLYGIWQANSGSIVSSFPLTIANGSFETPSNESPPAGYEKNFFCLYSEGAEGLEWLTTAPDGKIEIGSVSTNLSVKSCVDNYHTALARDGVQFAELNANKIGALYQDVATVPGVTLHWGFSHKAREAGDALALIIGSTNEFDQALGVYIDRQSAGAAGWQQAVLDEIKSLDLQSLQVTYHMADYDASNLYGWQDLTGEYKVPAGQNVTKFAFLSLSTNGTPSKGNLIDMVYFTMSEPLQTSTLTVFASPGGTARVNDGASALTTVSEDAPYFKIVTKGQRIVVSPVAEADWSFLGLYAGTVFYPLAECDAMLDFAMPDANRKLTLLFARDRTVTFNAEGGSYPASYIRLSMASPECELGTPVRSGYNFKGWRELTSGNIYPAGDAVRYEVEAQYDENVRSYLTLGNGGDAVRQASDNGMVLSAVWEIAAESVQKKLVSFVDVDYASSESPQPFKRLGYSLLEVGGVFVPRNQKDMTGIFNNTTTARPAGHEPTGWTCQPVGSDGEIDFDYVYKVEHRSDDGSAFFVVSAVTNGVYDTFRIDGAESLRFVARWDRFYDVVRLEDDGMTTNRTVWVPKSWLDAKGYAGIGEANYRDALESAGANGVPLWQSYVFGLDPTNSASVARNLPLHRRPGGKAVLTLGGVQVAKYLNDIYEAKSGSQVFSALGGRDYRTYSVRFALMGADDRVNGPWTQIGEEQASSEFQVDADLLVYRYYRIEGRVGP